MAKNALDVEYSRNYIRFVKMTRSLPELNGRLLLGLSAKSAYELIEMYLSGQMLTFENYRRTGKTGFFSSRGNRRLVSGKLAKNKQKIDIKSSPSNLFRRSRRGYNDNPRYRSIIPDKLSRRIAGKLEKWAEKYLKTIVESEIGRE